MLYHDGNKTGVWVPKTHTKGVVWRALLTYYTLLLLQYYGSHYCWKSIQSVHVCLIQCGLLCSINTTVRKEGRTSKVATRLC